MVNGTPTKHGFCMWMVEKICSFSILASARIVDFVLVIFRGNWYPLRCLCTNAAVDFLEKFRHGPENYNEWNFILWRIKFPLVTLVIFAVLALAGKFGHAIYSLIVCPVWYFSNFVLVTYPFFLVFRFQELDDGFQIHMWKGLGFVSVGISFIEWYMSSNKSRYSWIAGNTLYGIGALVAIPFFFQAQSRTARENIEMINTDELQYMHISPSANQNDVPQLINANSPLCSRISTSTLSEELTDDALLLSRTSLSVQPKASSYRPLILTIGKISICVVWLVMFSSYQSSRGTQMSHGGSFISQYWFILYILSPVVVLILYFGRNFMSTFCFEHLIAYSIVVVHLPMFLGHLCLKLFAMAEDGASRDWDPTWSSWMKFGVSILYLFTMQCYFYVLTHVVNAMSEPFSHPSLLYIGQLYYYLFWYILVGSDTPFDALYWGMLLVNNIHIAFLNTGIYSDVKESSVSCLAVPIAAACVPATNTSIPSSTSIADLQEATHPLSPKSLREKLASYPRNCSTNSRSHGNRCRVEGANRSHGQSTEHLRPLYFLMKLAEQDNMADTTALILVPSLLTLLAVLDKPSHGFSILYEQMNMWLRCICMFIGRLGGAYLAREIFTFKLRTRLRSGNVGTIEGISTRLWIQRLMLQDFHRHYWYLMVVTIVVTFACFERIDLPFRFALLT